MGERSKLGRVYYRSERIEAVNKITQQTSSAPVRKSFVCRAKTNSDITQERRKAINSLSLLRVGRLPLCTRLVRLP